MRSRQKDKSGGTQVREGEEDTQDNRIIEHQQLDNSHSSSFTLTGEIREGLASILTGQCSLCKHTITLETPKVPPKTVSEVGMQFSCKMATGGGPGRIYECVRGACDDKNLTERDKLLAVGGKRCSKKRRSRREEAGREMIFS